MRKTLLTLSLFCAMGMMAQSDLVPNPPQGGFYLSGINGETTQTTNNTLVYTPGTEDIEGDIEEGIYRYINEEMEISSCPDGFKAIGSEGLDLGYDANHEFYTENIINDYSSMIGMAPDGAPVNCELTPGTYKVILASFQDDPDIPMTWTIQFTNTDSGETVTAYYITGFNDMEYGEQGCKFVGSELEGTQMFGIPKFYIESCEDGFYITNGTVKFGSFDGQPVEAEEGMAFATLIPDGPAVQSNLNPGYYTVSFLDFGAMAMVTFNYCQNQDAPDECEYYLNGFEGFEDFSDEVKFTRTVTEETYEDEDTGKEETITTVNYIIQKIHLSGAPEGFLIQAPDYVYEINYGDLDEDGEDDIEEMEETQFWFGTNDILKMPVSSEMGGIGFLGIYGDPIEWLLPEGDYTVTLFVNGTMGNVTFTVYQDDPGIVESLIDDANTAPVYYDLQGRKVANPDKGFFIKKTGNKVEKIMK
ncbi:MAG: hypothetical protein J1F16_02255 [Muribaculaceae bacterium]|nr:hypothetical protein [Muribaculaceae bacterium]